MRKWCNSQFLEEDARLLAKYERYHHRAPPAARRFNDGAKAYAGWFPLVIPANGPASINMNGSVCLSPSEYIVCFPPTSERMRGPATLNSTDGLANSIH